ncbi:MAG: hypothetical protein AB1705_22660 [Verrucomicrobiota bacterium]
MNGPTEPKGEREFYNVVKFASAFSIALMAAYLYSVKEVNPALKIEVGLGSVLVFLGSGAMVWFAMRAVFGEGKGRFGGGAGSQRRWLIGLSALLTLGMLAGFVTALKNVSSIKKLEVIQGTALAVMVLAMVGVIFLQVVKFLERDSARNEEPHDPHQPPH